MAIDFHSLQMQFKQQREINAKPFPVWALLILYNKGKTQDLYCDYFEGFRLLHKWLGPIQLTSHIEPIPKLYRSYEMQELAKILNTSQENLNHAYITSLNIKELVQNGNGNGYGNGY
jgi:hypothetical protein